MSNGAIAAVVSEVLTPISRRFLPSLLSIDDPMQPPAAPPDPAPRPPARARRPPPPAGAPLPGAAARASGRAPPGAPTAPRPGCAARRAATLAAPTRRFTSVAPARNLSLTGADRHHES